MVLRGEMNHHNNNPCTPAGGCVGWRAPYAKTPEELATAVQGRLSALAQAQELVLPIAAGEAERSTTLDSLIKTNVSPYDDPAADAPSRIALSGCDPEIAGRAEIGRAHV